MYLDSGVFVSAKSFPLSLFGHSCVNAIEASSLRDGVKRVEDIQDCRLGERLS